MDLPVKFDWLDHHFYQTVLRTMPSKVQNTVKEDGVNQVRRRVHELVFLLMQHAGLGIAKEKQLVWEKIRTPTQCTDPAAAVAELRSWFRAFDRLAELDMASPDVDEIYDNVVAIYERIFEDHPDGNVVWRWRKLRDEVQDEVVKSYTGLSALNKYALEHLRAMVFEGSRGGNTGLPAASGGEGVAAKAKANAKACAAAAAAVQPPRQQQEQPQQQVVTTAAVQRIVQDALAAAVHEADHRRHIDQDLADHTLVGSAMQVLGQGNV